MQTFLPYPDFAASAAVLDDRRLGRQRVEVLQILRALTWPTYRGWKHHPATAMWRGFVPALVAYGLAVCEEWRRRGHPDAVHVDLLGFGGGDPPHVRTLAVEGRLPPWLGFEPFHVSHRSALVRKTPEHYRRHFPDVPDDLPYVWPNPAFPLWPVRRGAGTGLAPLPLPTALAALGLGAPRIEQAQTVDALQRGDDVVLALAPGGGATTSGLIAGLCLPGPTLWLSPHLGDGVDVAEPRVDALRPAAHGEGSGPPATSGARRPAPVDVAAMQREVDSPVEFVFHRPASLRTSEVRRAILARRPGLVVVEHADAGSDDDGGVVADVVRRCGEPLVLAHVTDAGAADRVAAALRLRSPRRLAA